MGREYPGISKREIYKKEESDERIPIKITSESSRSVYRYYPIAKKYEDLIWEVIEKYTSQQLLSSIIKSLKKIGKDIDRIYKRIEIAFQKISKSQIEINKIKDEIQELKKEKEVLENEISYLKRS